jgi:hypothetical protein
MADDDTTDGGEAEGPGLRQKLHWATGDRDAEARALADRAGDAVDEEDAYVAVKRAHGELRDELESGGEQLATVEEARDVAEGDDAP